YNKVWNTPSPDYKHHAINIPGGLVGAASPVAAHMLTKPPVMPGMEGGYSPYLYPNRSPGRQSPPVVPYSQDKGGFNNQNSLPYDDVVAATDGFANANMLGQGGFGLVYKGVLPGGKQVAVKSLKSGSGQGEREFQAEVDIISRVHHRHLVSLVGYCIAAEKRLLVYEFVPNNTLEYHLHKSGGKSPLDFSRRVRIALGSAKGLAYLHEDCHPRIIHRDIKAANILLDYNFEAQVADFGLAKLYNDTNTHVSTRVMGTFGYLAPEYASSGKLTDKSDVFSFGVVLLELITGRRPVDPNDQSMEDCSLVDWARSLLAKALAEGNYDELVDHRLEQNYNVQDMAKMAACAAASIRHSGKRRPRMSQIVRTLEGDMSLEALDGTRTGQNNTTDYDTAAYSADLKKFRRMAFGGDSTTTTSEYGLNPSASSSNVTSPRNSGNSSQL
ncbi:hypothetical protein V2J09_001894, partial [Rumex salicifolius]